MTEPAKPATPFGLAGICVGGLALILTLVHFWIGPLAPEPSLEEAVTDAARSIKDAAVAAWKGEEVEAERRSGFNIDKGLDAVSVALAGVAMVLGILGFARREPLRAPLSAVFLGVCALALEFAFWAFGALLIAAVVLFVSSLLGLG